MWWHDGQKRHSGEDYFTHPVAVAAILTEQRLDDATIVTALLHDTIEDTKSTYTEVSRQFSEEVAELVDGVTKLTNLQLSSSETKQSENFWYAEYLPADTLLYTVNSPRGGSARDLDLYASELGTRKWLQVGGNETTGQGVCRVTVWQT